MKGMAASAALTIGCCAASFACATPALGAAPKPADPNEKICEKVEVIGSRVAMKRVCLTRAQWADKRKAEREFTSDLQRSMGGNRCTEADPRKGAPSC